ncbi:MAG: DUF3159 domain-containing protein [Acidimicrobiales bacterium]
MSNEPEPQSPSEVLAPMPRMGAMIDSVMPVILFIGINRLVGLSWAIGAATLWSLKVAYSRKRRGLPIGKFLPLITLAIIARGVVGIITDSEAVYFGIGIATKAGVGLVLIGSAVAGRNLLAKYAPLALGFDEATVNNPIYQRAMDRVAWLAGLAELVSAAFDVWLFNNSSVDGYLTIRFFVNWPFTTIVLIVAINHLSNQLDKIPGFPGMGELLEQRLTAY